MIIRTLLLAVCCFKPRSAQKRGIVDYAGGLQWELETARLYRSADNVEKEES